MSESASIHEILERHWGYSDFREGQQQAIESAISGQDVFVLFPTGGGKSLCYQIAALAQPGVCIVISPLIALMQDQVAQLKARHVKADFLHAGMSYVEIDRLLDNAIYGDTKLLYIAPERLKHPLTLERMRQMKINLIAVDEAHCISQWGHDFRPAYREIHELKEELPRTPIMALTATATPKVRQDIIEQLQIPEATVIEKSFHRENLHFVVRTEEDKIAQIRHILDHVEGAAIVYVRSRKKTLDMAEILRKQGINAAAYHAGMSFLDREAVMKSWMDNQMRVVCATNAFGMGVDKADVRVVIHIEIPPSLEEYYQEAGRAGRDGEKAYCVLMYNHADEIAADSKFKMAFPDKETIFRTYACLGHHYNLATGSGAGESFDFDYQSFVEKYNLGYQVTGHCLRILQQSGWINLTDAFFQPSKVMMVADKMLMYDYQLRHESASIFLKTLLRTYEGLYTQFTQISEKFIAKLLNSSEKIIIQFLEQLQADEIVDYEPASDSAKITFMLPRSTEDNFRIDEKMYHFRKEMTREHLSSVKKYLDAKACRMQILLDYFGESRAQPCGQCDLCLRKDAQPDEATFIKFKAIILKQIGRGASMKDILAAFPSNRHSQVHHVIRRMERESWIETVNDLVHLHPSKKSQA